MQTIPEIKTNTDMHRYTADDLHKFVYTADDLHKFVNEAASAPPAPTPPAAPPAPVPAPGPALDTLEPYYDAKPSIFVQLDSFQQRHSLGFWKWFTFAFNIELSK